MSTLIGVVSWLFQVYAMLILARVILSWLHVSPYGRTLNHPLVYLLNQLTDPLLVPLRRVIPPLGGMIDLSPIAALFLIEIVRRVVVGLLVSLL